MRKILIKNIKGLVQAGEEIPTVLRGAEMADVPLISDAFLALEDGAVVAYGPMSELQGIDDWRDLELIDAEGKYVLPAFCDSHTHTVLHEAEKRNLLTESMD